MRRIGRLVAFLIGATVIGLPMQAVAQATSLFTTCPATAHVGVANCYSPMPDLVASGDVVLAPNATFDAQEPSLDTFMELGTTTVTVTAVDSSFPFIKETCTVSLELGFEPPPAPSSGVNTLVHFADFENGPQGWHPVDLSFAEKEPQWRQETDPNIVGSKIWWCGREDACYQGGSGYGPGWIQMLDTDPITIPANANGLVLYHRYDTAGSPAGPVGDVCTVELDGNVKLARYAGSSGGYTTSVIDLSAYRGQTHFFRFRFDSTSDTTSGGDDSDRSAPAADLDGAWRIAFASMDGTQLNMSGWHPRVPTTAPSFPVDFGSAIDFRRENDLVDPSVTVDPAVELDPRTQCPSAGWRAADPYTNGFPIRQPYLQSKRNSGFPDSFALGIESPEILAQVAPFFVVEFDGYTPWDLGTYGVLVHYSVKSIVPKNNAVCGFVLPEGRATFQYYSPIPGAWYRYRFGVRRDPAAPVPAGFTDPILEIDPASYAMQIRLEGVDQTLRFGATAAGGIRAPFFDNVAVWAVGSPCGIL